MMNHSIAVSPKIIIAGFVVFMFFLRWRSGYFKNVPAYLKRIDRKRVLLGILLMVIPVLACMVYADQRMLNMLLASRDSSFVILVADFGGAIGRSVHPWIFLVVLYLGSKLIRQDSVSQSAIAALFSATLASVLSSIFKFVFLRARPYGNLGPLSFLNSEGIFEDARVYQSFPSGDVVVVAAVAFYFIFKTKHRLFQCMLALLPLCTAVARVNANKHWPSDVVVAIGLGLFSAYHIFNYERQGTHEG